MHELDTLMKEYEQANMSRDWSRIEPFIHQNASYFFTDGTFIGKEAVQKAITGTFARIQDETYAVRDIEWVTEREDVAVCRYTFHWQGLVDGEPTEGDGRGTNVWHKTEERWQIVHEHLSH